MPDVRKSWLHHSDRWNLVLRLEDEEAMVLDPILDTGERTTRVQVVVRFVDQNGQMWSAERIVKMRLTRETI